MTFCLSTDALPIELFACGLRSVARHIDAKLMIVATEDVLYVCEISRFKRFTGFDRKVNQGSDPRFFQSSVKSFTALSARVECRNVKFLRHSMAGTSQLSNVIHHL